MQTIQRIPLEGAKNTRDLGGFTTMDGRSIIPKRLIRSGRLGALTEEDKQVLLDEFGLKTIVDFRMETERQAIPDPSLQNVAYLLHEIRDARAMCVMHHESIRDPQEASRFLDQLQNPRILSSDFFVVFYRCMITAPHAIGQFRAFFDVLLQQESGAVLWHCSMGKDRTGIATALLLYALGIAQQDILEDYLLTNTFLQSIDPQQAVRDGVRTEYWMAAMETIRDNFGSVDEYLENQMGLSPRKVQRLRELYLR